MAALRPVDTTAQSPPDSMVCPPFVRGIMPHHPKDVEKANNPTLEYCGACL